MEQEETVVRCNMPKRVIKGIYYYKDEVGVPIMYVRPHPSDEDRGHFIGYFNRVEYNLNWIDMYNVPKRVIGIEMLIMVIGLVKHIIGLLYWVFVAVAASMVLLALTSEGPLELTIDGNTYTYIRGE